MGTKFVTFRRIKVTIRSGRGKGDEENYFEQILENYESTKQAYDEASETERDRIKDRLNEFCDDLGDDFEQSKDDFEATATDIVDKGKFIDLMVELGICQEVEEHTGKKG